MENNKVIRASSIGYPCTLRAWYQVNGGQPDFPPRVRRILDMGTALEPVAVNWLEQMGWQIHYNPGSIQASDVITIAVDGGVIEGHYDVIGWHAEHGFVVMDIKTMNGRAYAKWRSDGTREAYPQYLTQIMLYAKGVCEQGLFPIDAGTDPATIKLAIVGVNRDTGDFEIEYLTYEPELVATAMERASVACTSEEAPIPPEMPGGWVCGYCPFRDRCPLVNFDPTEGANTELTLNLQGDKEFLEAVQQLDHARIEAKYAEEVQEKSKQLIDERVAKYGVTSFTIDGKMFVERKVSVSKRFDSKRLEKERPDIHAAYKTESTTIRYNLKDIEDGWNG